MSLLGAHALECMLRLMVVALWSQFSPASPWVPEMELGPPGLYFKPLYRNHLAGPLSHISEGEMETVIFPDSSLRLPVYRVQTSVARPGALCRGKAFRLCSWAQAL